MSLEINLILIALFMVAYAHVWNHQHDRVRPSDIIRRLQRDNRVLRKKLNKNHILGLGLVVLFLVPAFYSPQNLEVSDGGLPSLVESQIQEDFVISADGAESTESITSFSETSDDDTMVQVDPICLNQDAYSFEMGIDSDGYDDALHGDGDSLVGGSSTVAYADGIVKVTASASPGWAISYFFGNASLDKRLPAGVYNVYVNPYNVSSSTVRWVLAVQYLNGTRLFSDLSTMTFKLSTHYSNTTGLVGPIVLTITDQVQAYYIYIDDSGEYVCFDYILFTPYDTPDFTNSFVHSFADVSDWTTSDTSISTDGDLATITENGAGSTGRAYASFSSTDYFEYYYEFRIETMTATTANLEFWDGSAYNTLKTFTAAGTYKGIISDADAATMQRIGFLVGSEGGNIKPDYLRISPSDEMGWQHDGSTTAGVSDDGQGSVTYTYSTDGDILTINCTRTSYLVDNPDVYFAFDTTSTVADVERDYYPFLDVYITSLTEVGSTVYMAFQGDGYRVMNHRLTVGHNRINILSTTTADNDKTIIWFYGMDCYSVGDSFEIGFDWGKAYSIANFTVSQSGAGTDTIAYCDNGILTYTSTTNPTSFILWHDPLLSVSRTTFNVWNITSSTGLDTTSSNDINFYDEDGKTNYDETRGNWQGLTGTFTDFHLTFYTATTITISQIKFIEDGTAPTVVRSFANPPEPENDESVTLSAVIEDTVEVYTVKFNAIVYPTGFSDVDYSATEQSDNLWSYSFSTLSTVGHYTFKIIASDGANTNALTEYAYIDLVVRTASTTTLELELWQVNLLDYHINVDWKTTLGNTTLKVYDNDTLEATGTSEDATLQFSKSTVVGVHVLDFLIDAGSSEMWKNDTKYEIAQSTMDIDIEAWGVESTTIEITGISNIDMKWYVYNEGVYSTESGSETEDIGFHFTFSKNTAVGKHNFSIYFNDTTDGTQNRWFNRSYTISTVYGEATIKAYFSSGIGITDIDDKFKIYINGTRSSDSFYADTSKSYEICIKDFFGNEIYNTSHAWSTFIDIEFDYHTLKIYSQVQNDPIYFVLTRGGSTISEYIGISEIIKYYLASGTYTYTFTQGGQIYTGDLVLTDDYYYTVTDLDLWDIMYKPDNAGGGTDLYSILSWYGIVGVFGLMFIGQIPKIAGFILSLFTKPKKPKKRMG